MESQEDRIKRIKAAVAIAITIAVPAEGLRRVAYHDPVGILTVCYGSTTQVQKGKVYSLEECWDRLDSDMQQAILTVDRCVPGLQPNVLAAFGDAVYNIGPRIACDTTKSTAARLLKAGKVGEACKQLPRWNRVNMGGIFVPLPGLTKRRNIEMNICLGGSDAIH